MDTQEQTQIFTQLQKVKEEKPEKEYSLDDEDQLTVSQILFSGQNSLDISPKKIVSDDHSRSELHKRERETVDNFSDEFEFQSLVMKAAVDVQASLAPEFPSFIKRMLRSHVTKGFWLGLPSKFCKLHLPKHDAAVFLEDGSGEKYKTNYLVNKAGLSGGWRGFSVAQKLLEGDVVVFHLVSPCKFKVYIVRANDFEVSDALSLLNSDASAKETDFAYAEKTSGTCKKEEKKHPMLETHDECYRDWNNMYSDTTEGSKFSGYIPDIKNFNIVLNGLTIDYELSTHIRTKYYDLCRTRKAYVHEGLLKTINSKMAVGIISETINIADAIRACKISTSPRNFTIWDKTLEAFQLLGMDIGFLRDRLNQLANLSAESTERSKRYEEASIERDSVQREMKSLELKILEVRQDKKRLDDEIEDLKGKAKSNEFLFHKEAIAPW